MWTVDGRRETEREREKRRKGGVTGRLRVQWRQNRRTAERGNRKRVKI